MKGTGWWTARSPWLCLSLLVTLLVLVNGCANATPRPETTPPSPAEIAALVAEANAAYEAFDWPRATTLFAQVVRYEPEVAEWWTRYGWALHNSQRFTEALAALERAEQLAPDNFWNPFGKARAYAALGRLSEALVAVERAIALAPQRPGPHRLRARLYLQAGDPDRALAAVLTGLYYVPEDAQLQSMLAELADRLALPLTATPPAPAD